MRTNKVIAIFLSLALILAIAGLCGCEDWDYPSIAELPKNYIAFEPYDWQSPDMEDVFEAFDYNGRTYISYAEVPVLYYKDVDGCLGYIARHSDWMKEGEVSDSQRILSLRYSDSDDYLLSFWVPTYMSPPVYAYRAVDTRGKEIDTPKFISEPDPENDLEYEFWKAE